MARDFQLLHQNTYFTLSLLEVLTHHFAYKRVRLLFRAVAIEMALLGSYLAIMQPLPANLFYRREFILRTDNRLMQLLSKSITFGVIYFKVLPFSFNATIVMKWPWAL